MTEGLAHNDHAYQQVWDYSGDQKVKGKGKKQGGRLVDLVQVLKILSRLSRQANVAVVYCQRMEDTLAKRTPVVPEYMAGYELLNAVNNDVLMGSTGTTNEEVGSSNPLVLARPAVEPEQVTEVHKNGKQSGWSKDSAIDELNNVVAELTSATLVKAAIIPLIAQIHAPCQPRDRHPVVSLAKKLLLNWRIRGVAFADSMDLAVADQMEVLENVYRVLAWSDAVKETARRINLVAYVSKEPRAERAMDL